MEYNEQTDGAGVEFEMAFHGRLDADDVGEDHALQDVLDAEGHEEGPGRGEALQPVGIPSAQAEARRVIIRRAEERHGRHGITVPVHLYDNFFIFFALSDLQWS